MSQAHVLSLIQQGQQLLKQGDRAAARELLIQAVKAQPQDGAVWLELSKAASDASEEQRCIDEALKRDPQNPQVQAMHAVRGLLSAPAPPSSSHSSTAPKLRALAQPTTPMSAPPAPNAPPQQAQHPAAPPAAQPESALNAIVPWINEPPNTDRCPYCAYPEPGGQRCPRCKNKLVVRVHKTHSSAFYILCTILLARANLAFLYLALAYFAVPASSGQDSGSGLGMAAVAPVIIPGLIFVAYPLFMTTALVLRQTWAWLVGVIFASLDLAFTVLSVFLALSEGYFALRIVPILFSLAMLSLYFLISDEVMGEDRRIGLPPASQLPKSGHGFFDEGLEYSKQKLWYLAAKMWQRAVNYEETNFGYRRALGTAYLELGELVAAEAQLAAAKELNPGDELTHELQSQLAQKQQKAMAAVV